MREVVVTKTPTMRSRQSADDGRQDPPRNVLRTSTFISNSPYWYLDTSPEDLRARCASELPDLVVVCRFVCEKNMMMMMKKKKLEQAKTCLQCDDFVQEVETNYKCLSRLPRRCCVGRRRSRGLGDEDEAKTRR